MSLLRTASTKQAALAVARRLAQRTATCSAFVSSSSSIRSFSRSSTPLAPSSKVKVWRVDNPYTGEIISEVPQITAAQANTLVAQADATYKGWKGTTIEQRIQLVNKWIVEFGKNKEAIATSVSTQMGKPLGQARGEVETAIKRAQALVSMATEVLKEEVITADPNSGLLRKITKEPIGVILALVPWNYPLLCAVNSVVAATLCGNTVLLKHSDRTPAVADWFESTFLTAGAPKGLVTAFHADHDLVQKTIANPAIAYVQFTGSVAGGRAVYKATAETRFIDVGLELGGKDPAYVASDADLDYAISNVVDGGLYNAGQSCCAVERVYVHESLYEPFLAGATKLFNDYKLGNPLVDSTTMGPIAQPNHVSFLQNQVDEALVGGARLLAGGRGVHDALGHGRFFQPTLLADCKQNMRVVSEESFGPILAVMSVKNDEEAIAKMNDSQFGLTASVWTSDMERATKLAEQMQAGTVFMNRCDFLDPYLAWSGRKDSGKGIGLSTHGFAPFLRTKSYNFRPNTK